MVKRSNNGQFAAGNNANPKGRPKVRKEFRDMARKWSLVCLHRVYDIVTAEDAAARDTIAGTRLIVEYGYGRPMQDLERERFDVDKRLTEAQIKKLENRQQQRGARGHRGL